MIQAKDFPTREAFLAAVEPKGRDKPPAPKRFDAQAIFEKKEAEDRLQYPCVYRGVEQGPTPCVSCGEKKAQVYACEKHKACVISGTPKDGRIRRCITCLDRREPPEFLPFGAFANRYNGKTGLLVGRGATQYHWPGLAHHDGPIFAVNDAVLHVEKFTSSPDVFLFAQDLRIAETVVDRTKAICVVPVGGQYGFAVSRMELPGDARIVWYTRSNPGQYDLLRQSREEMAVSRRLFRSPISPKPTTCLAIHFAWFCGVSHLLMIGCNGEGTSYNPQMANVSESPETMNLNKYPEARRADDEVLKALHLSHERHV